MGEPNPGGAPLWVGLSIEEIKELIKFSTGELCRCHAQKERESLGKFQYNHALELEIKFYERAQDNHFSWLRDRTRQIDPFKTGLAG